MNNPQFAFLPVSDLEEMIRRLIFEEINEALNSNKKSDDELLTREELAAKLKKNPKTISNYMRAGMPYRKIFKNPYFKLDEVLEFMKNKKG